MIEMEYGYIKENYDSVIDDIKKVCAETGADFSKIKLVAVSKTFPPEQIMYLHNQGHFDFGENKVQELKSKFDIISDKSINWHLIGHLQTNKVKYISDFVSLIHSVDSQKLAGEINKQAEKSGRVIDILIQVNTSDEDQKSGIEPGETEELCKIISELHNVNLKGLMTIGMFTDDENIIRKNFRILKNLFGELKSAYKGFEYLSMGMTSDYRIAIEEGANMLRIGSAVFGKRNYQI